MASPTHTVIAIDGPAASGKSSVAREVARRVGFAYLNSGAIYRAITWFLLQSGSDVNDAAAVTRLLETSGLRSDLVIDHAHPPSHLRDERVNAAVSRVSAIPTVRKIADEQMHRAALTSDLVVEGRDIGSVVFPDTPFKFYIDASPEVRARRRAAEGVQDAIAARDRADSLRAAAPLVTARDAEVIDTSNMTIEEVVNEIVRKLRRKNFQFADSVSATSRA